MDTKTYEDYIRTRITDLRLQKGVSEHRMSLDLDKSGSYIRGITNGLSMPSVRELLKIMAYFNITPSDFFQPLQPKDTKLDRLVDRLHDLDDTRLDKVNIFLDLLE
jgi:transcriptional regulator with XRE-family HTH domain